MAQNSKSIRRYSLDEISTIPEGQNAKRLYKYMNGRDLIAPISGGVNIVLSREIRRNVAIAAEMAVGIAKADPTRRVVYVNSYASMGLLSQSIRAACAKHGLTKDDSPKNICVIEIKIDQWDKEALRLAMTGFEADGTPREGAQEATVILNSFEFASLNRNKRPRIVRDLLQLQEEYSASVILFSHNLRNDLLAGIPSRGAVGLIATKAVTIFKIPDPFERLKKQSESVGHSYEADNESAGGVHELGMRGVPHKIMASDGSDSETGEELPQAWAADWLKKKIGGGER